MTQPTPIIEAFRNLLGVDTPNIDNLIVRLSSGNAKSKEGPLLEFKASYKPKKGDKDTPGACRWNVIKAIVGMANSQGGCVVLGLAENKDTKELERGNGDPDNVLDESGKEDKDLAEHTRKALFKGNSFKISENETIKVDPDFWKQLESQTNGTKGFVTCRSHVGGDANGFPVVAIFVEPIPVDTPITQVEIIKKSETSSEEHLIGYYHRSESAAETFFSAREKWEEKWQTISKSGDRLRVQRKDPENYKREREYLTFVRQRNPQRTLKALSEKISNLESTPGKPVFSSVNPPQATNFVGRNDDLKKLHSLLSDGRIPVVTGPGGTGKTELVLQYAEQHKNDYKGGLFQIDMEEVKSWDDAFRQLLGTTRVDMWNLLGFPNPMGINPARTKNGGLQQRRLREPSPGAPRVLNAFYLSSTTSNQSRRFFADPYLKSYRCRMKFAWLPRRVTPMSISDRQTAYKNIVFQTFRRKRHLSFCLRTGKPRTMRSGKRPNASRSCSNTARSTCGVCRC